MTMELLREEGREEEEEEKLVWAWVLVAHIIHHR